MSSTARALQSIALAVLDLSAKMNTVCAALGCSCCAVCIALFHLRKQTITYLLYVYIGMVFTGKGDRVLPSPLWPQLRLDKMTSSTIIYILCLSIV